MALSTAVDLVNVNTATTGTGTMTLGSAVSGWRGTSALVNGLTYSYKITDSGGGYEAGQGVYTSSGATMTRTAITESSNSGSAISLSGSATVIMTELSTDIVDAGRSFMAGSLIGANFDITTDQAISLAGPTNAAGTCKWIIDRIYIVNASTSLTTAKGTFYAAASKANVLWSTSTGAQPYTGLVASTDVCVMSSFMATGFGSAQWHFNYFTTPSATIYLSLSTAQGAAATADVYVVGLRLA